MFINGPASNGAMCPGLPPSPLVTSTTKTHRPSIWYCVTLWSFCILMFSPKIPPFGRITLAVVTASQRNAKC